MSDTDGMRTCSVCQETRTLKHFYPTRTDGVVTGHRRQCKDCVRDANARRNRERYATDPDFRAAMRERGREQYADDPEYRKAVNARHHERLADDPDAQETRKERARQRDRERYATDAEYRERRIAAARSRRQASPRRR